MTWPKTVSAARSSATRHIHTYKPTNTHTRTHTYKHTYSSSMTWPKTVSAARSSATRQFSTLMASKRTYLGLAYNKIFKSIMCACLCLSLKEYYSNILHAHWSWHRKSVSVSERVLQQVTRQFSPFMASKCTYPHTTGGLHIINFSSQ
jgi:hypothetical protein